MLQLSRRHALLSLLGSALAARLPLCVAAAEPALQSPFPARAAMPQPVKRKFDCEPAPAPVTALASISKYQDDDRSRSKIDAAAEARLRQANEPVVQFSRGLTRMTDDVVSDPAAAAAQAACAWDWLSLWAKGRGLEGDKVAETARKWELATAACAVLKLRGRSTPSADQQAAVRDWLTRLATEVREDYSRHRDKASRRNNHLWWAAWAVTAAGIAVDDRRLFDWGMEQYRFALTTIQADGHLPAEAARASRALFYHAFALLPLVMIAEAGEANGQALWREGGGKLRRLAGFVLDNYADPAAIEKLARQRQDAKESLNPRSAAWLEPYYARTRDPRAAPWLRKLRPLSQRSAGGDLTAMFGLPVAP